MSGVSHGEETPIDRTTRLPSVTLAAWLQLLFAAVFVIAPIVLILYGSAGQAVAIGTGLHRKPIRLFRHGATVTRKTYQKIAAILRQQAGRAPMQG